MTTIGLVTASTRPTRIGHHVAAWVASLAPPEAELRHLDLRELDLPFLDEPGQPADGDYAHEHTRTWSALVSGCDAMLLVMPEYNRGYNAALKNAIDYLYAEWNGMPVALVGYGWRGAEFARSALRQSLERLRMTVVGETGLRFEESLELDGTMHPTPQAADEVRALYGGLLEPR